MILWPRTHWDIENLYYFISTIRLFRKCTKCSVPSKFLLWRSNFPLFLSKFWDKILSFDCLAHLLLITNWLQLNDLSLKMYQSLQLQEEIYGFTSYSSLTFKANLSINFPLVSLTPSELIKRRILCLQGDQKLMSNWEKIKL